MIVPKNVNSDACSIAIDIFESDSAEQIPSKKTFDITINVLANPMLKNNMNST